MNRRDMLKCMGLSAAALGLNVKAQEAAAKPAPKKALLAAQMYTVREFTKTPAGLAESCAKVKKMGYDGVQLSGHGPIAATEIKKILEGEGLQCAVTHTSIDAMDRNPNKVIDEHKMWNCKYVAIGGFFPGKDVKWDRALWENFVKRYNGIAEKFAGSGITIGYHNHSHEFVQCEDFLPIDFLMKNLSPSIWFEFDLFWIARAGADPVKYIEAVPNRCPVLHFKDIRLAQNRSTLQMCEVGDGNLNWQRILPACRASNVEWYAVERDSGDLPAFDSLQRSLENLRGKLGC